MNFVVPLPRRGRRLICGNRQFRIGNCRWGCARRRPGRLSRRGNCDWSGKTRVRLHRSRAYQYHQRDQCDGRDSGYEVNP